MCVCVCVCFREDKVEPLDPPADSKPGDRVYVDGYQHDVAGGTIQIHTVYTVYMYV